MHLKWTSECKENGNYESTRDMSERFQVYWSDSWEERTGRVDNNAKKIMSVDFLEFMKDSISLF